MIRQRSNSADTNFFFLFASIRNAINNIHTHIPPLMQRLNFTKGNPLYGQIPRLV